MYALPERQRVISLEYTTGMTVGDALRLSRIDAEFPELEPETGLQVGQTAAQLGNTLALAVQQGWLSNDDAAQVYQHFLGEAVDLPSGHGATRPAQRAPRKAAR